MLLRGEWQPQGTVQWLPRVFPRQCLPEWVTAAESNLWQHSHNNNQGKEPGPGACTHEPSNRWHCRTTNILWRTVTLMLAHQNPVNQRTQPKDILYYYSLRLLIWSMVLIFLDLICVKLYCGEGFETALNHHGLAAVLFTFLSCSVLSAPSLFPHLFTFFCRRSIPLSHLCIKCYWH